MKEAKYEIVIPKHDELGNPLVEIATLALKHMVNRQAHGDLKVHNLMGHIDRDREMHVNGQTKLHDVVVLQATDHPQVDSSVKQLAAWVGDVVNHQHIITSKHSENGIQTWPVANSQHIPGQPAESHMLAQTQADPP